VEYSLCKPKLICSDIKKITENKNFILLEVIERFSVRDLSKKSGSHILINNGVYLASKYGGYHFIKVSRTP